MCKIYNVCLQGASRLLFPIFLKEKHSLRSIRENKFLVNNLNKARGIKTELFWRWLVKMKDVKTT